MNFEATAKALQAAREAAPGLLDDERASRVCGACAMVEAALGRLASARTTARVTNRIPAVLRVLRRARAELSADTRTEWAAVAAPVVAELEAVSKRIEEAHRIASEAASRVSALLEGSQAA